MASITIAMLLEILVCAQSLHTLVPMDFDSKVKICTEVYKNKHLTPHP